MPNPTVLVIGGTSGIGHATAERLAFGGAAVTVFGRKKPGILSTGASFVEMDLRDDGSILNALKSYSASDARVDAVVYAAGITVPKTPIEDFDRKVWEEVLRVNVTGAMLALKSLAAALHRAKGSVVFVNSVSARQSSGLSGFEYTASKAALTGLAHQLAREWAKDGVRVNSVYPGATWTPMLEAALRPGDKEAILAKTPTGKIIESSEVAELIAFLVEKRIPSLTGAGFDLSGGVYLS